MNVGDLVKYKHAREDLGETNCSLLVMDIKEYNSLGRSLKILKSCPDEDSRVIVVHECWVEKVNGV